MKLDFPISLIGSALAFYGRHDGGPPLQAQQVGQPANVTESLTEALRPVVNVDDPACAAAIAAVSADPAAAQCCAYAEQLNNQTLLSAPAASGWLDGFCGAECPSRYNASAAQIAAGCEFKGMYPEETESAFTTAADLVSALACVKDPAGGYCVVTVWQSLQVNATLWASNNTSFDPDSMNSILTRICEIPCGILLLDAIQYHTGHNGSAVCSMLSSGLPPILTPPADPSATSTPVAAGPPPTSSPAAPTETSTPLPGPARKLVRRFRDILN